MIIKRILLIQFLFITTLIFFSCSTDDTITGNTDGNLAKPSGTDDINSNDPYGVSGLLWVALFMGGEEGHDNCLLGIELYAPYLLSDDHDSETQCSYNNLYDQRASVFEKSYDFRDNYLANSPKGNKYINYYKQLSKYSIRNNLIGRYYKEHLDITPLAVKMAYDLQYGNDINSSIINDRNYDSVKELIRVYRNSNNHREIDGILDKIEVDVEKYYNKPKYEIEKDFK